MLLWPIGGCDLPSEGQDLNTEEKMSGPHAMFHPVTSFDKDKREELGYILPSKLLTLLLKWHGVI